MRGGFPVYSKTIKSKRWALQRKIRSFSTNKTDELILKLKNNRLTRNDVETIIRSKHHPEQENVKNEPEELIHRLKNYQLSRSEVESIIRSKHYVEQELKNAESGAAHSHISNSYPSTQTQAVPYSSSSTSQSSNISSAFSPTPLHPIPTLPQQSSIPGHDKAFPLYIERVGERRMLNLVASLAFWSVLLGTYIYFQRRNVGLGGLMDDNYSEYDEISWEDDDDEKQEELADEELDRYEQRRREWLKKLGVVTANPINRSDDHHKRKQKRVTFKDVCGCEEAKTDLKDLVHYLKNPDKFREMGVKLPKGVLLEGRPGTGKTLMARALAGEAKVPFLSTNGSSFDQIFVGVGVVRIKNLFNRAKELAPCIIFIDEIDAVGSTRSATTLTPHSSDTLNALLVEMDGFEENNGVIVVAATNMAERLDPALVRAGRFDRNIKVELPDKKTRKEIVSLYLKDRGDESVVDSALEMLVSNLAGSTGADLANIVNLAGIDAVKEGVKKISFKHLVEAKETVIMGRARPSMALSGKEKRITAYHEGGHAIIALYTKGANPIHKATLLPRGNALGMVWHAPADEHSQTKECMLASLDVAMGGRAAEEMIFGLQNVTTGAASDFNQATQMATQMVCQYGMSPLVGKVFYRPQDIEKLSPELQNLINKETRRLLDESYQRANAILNARSDKLEALAQALLDRETLTVEEIKEAISWEEAEVLSPKDGFKATPVVTGKIVIPPLSLTHGNETMSSI